MIDNKTGRNEPKLPMTRRGLLGSVFLLLLAACTRLLPAQPVAREAILIASGVAALRNLLPAELAAKIDEPIAGTQAAADKLASTGTGADAQPSVREIAAALSAIEGSIGGTPLTPEARDVLRAANVLLDLIQGLTGVAARRIVDPVVVQWARETLRRASSHSI